MWQHRHHVVVPLDLVGEAPAHEQALRLREPQGWRVRPKWRQLHHHKLLRVLLRTCRVISWRLHVSLGGHQCRNLLTLYISLNTCRFRTIIILILFAHLHYIILADFPLAGATMSRKKNNY
jgi:hypothetical protein